MGNKKFKNYTVREIKATLASGQIALKDLDTATLEKLMNYETDMLCFGEGDVDLITECADIMCERKTDIMSHDEFMAIVNKTFAGKIAEKPERLKTKKFKFKHILIIAAVLSVLVVGGTMVASALGFNLFENINGIARQQNGMEEDENGIAFYNGGETKKYSSLKEALSKENINIMYPTALPVGIAFESIQVADSSTGDMNILILTKNRAVVITVDTKVTSLDDGFESDNVYKSGGITYKLFEGDTENKYCAYSNVDNCSYIIQAKEYEDLIFVIDNMRER